MLRFLFFLFMWGVALGILLSVNTTCVNAKDTHNYFAGGVLVHNKNPVESSPKTSQKAENGIAKDGIVKEPPAEPPVQPQNDPSTRPKNHRLFRGVSPSEAWGASLGIDSQWRGLDRATNFDKNQGKLVFEGWTKDAQIEVPFYGSLGYWAEYAIARGMPAEAWRCYMPDSEGRSAYPRFMVEYRVPPDYPLARSKFHDTGYKWEGVREVQSDIANYAYLISDLSTGKSIPGPAHPLYEAAKARETAKEFVSESLKNTNGRVKEEVTEKMIDNAENLVMKYRLEDLGLNIIHEPNTYRYMNDFIEHLLLAQEIADLSGLPVAQVGSIPRGRKGEHKGGGLPDEHSDFEMTIVAGANEMAKAGEVFAGINPTFGKRIELLNNLPKSNQGSALLGFSSMEEITAQSNSLVEGAMVLGPRRSVPLGFKSRTELAEFTKRIQYQLNLLPFTVSPENIRFVGSSVTGISSKTGEIFRRNPEHDYDITVVISRQEFSLAGLMLKDIIYTPKAMRDFDRAVHNDKISKFFLKELTADRQLAKDLDTLAQEMGMKGVQFSVIPEDSAHANDPHISFAAIQAEEESN
jgi:hypothetical protein